MSTRGCAVLFLVAIVSIAGGTDRCAVATDWGSIKGRIIVENNPPELPMINVVAGGVNLTNERIVLGKDKELVNAIVYLRVAAAGRPVAIHSDYEAAFKKRVVIKHKGLRFVPHIVVAREGQTLELTNSDPFAYNTNIRLINFNKIIPPNGTVLAKVDQRASVPTPMACNIHPWMEGFLVALDHPYVAVTGDDGTFEIKNLPAGEHELQFWHETGYLKNGMMKLGTTDKRGRIKLKVPAGETLDLGDVMVRL